jgi:SAM-dependent methyltransferase
MAAYFANHARRTLFPWSLYHRDLAGRIAAVVRAHGHHPRVLVVGCGTEPYVEGGPEGATYHGCDLDPRAIDVCRGLYPAMADRLAVCPSGESLPDQGPFAAPFDVVVAKEVIEHILTPEPWARTLAARVALGGSLVLTTPNYGTFSTLPLLEATVLELVARRDGYSRAHIHPSKFDRRRLAALDVGPGMGLTSVQQTWSGWALLGHWTRILAVSP